MKRCSYNKYETTGLFSTQWKYFLFPGQWTIVNIPGKKKKRSINLRDVAVQMIYTLFAESHFAESHFAESMGHFTEFFLAKWARTLSTSAKTDF